MGEKKGPSMLEEMDGLGATRLGPAGGRRVC